MTPLQHLLRCRSCWLLAAPLLLTPLLGAAFWQPANLQSLLAAIAIEGIMCVGMTIVMVAGGFDLSIGSVMALAGITVIAAEGYGTPLAMALALGAAAMVGIVNGTLVTHARINPFIATLATMVIVRALVLTVTEQEPLSGSDSALMEAMHGSILGIPTVGLLLLVLAALGHLLLTRFQIGREIHALGSSEASARAAGVVTQRLTMLCYLLCSVSAGIAGIVLAGRLNTGSPVIGEQAALNVVTAVLLGGASLKGGIGTAWGSMAGLLCVGILENVMRLADVPAYWQRILQGGLLLAIVAFDRLSAMRGERAQRRLAGLHSLRSQAAQSTRGRGS